MVRTPFGANSIVAYGYNGQCESSVSIPVTIHSIDASITDSQHICIGGSTTLFVNSVTSVLYNWLNSTVSGSSQTVFPQVNTDYSVVLTDAYGCTDTLNSTVIIDEAVSVLVNPIEVETCLGESFTLEASGAIDYLWGDGQTDSLINLTALANEIISVTGYNGECSQDVEILVTVLPSPIVIISSNASSVNTGGGIQFGIGNSNASNYEWDFADGQSANFAIPYHEFLFSGSYFVTLTGSIGSCTTTDTLLVYVGMVGLQEKEEDLFVIYPNPIRDFVNIEFKTTAKYTVYLFNSNGQLIKEILPTDNLIRVSLQGYAKGVYYIQLKSKEKEYYKNINAYRIIYQ